MTKLLSTSALLLALASPAAANHSQYMALNSSCFYPTAGETKLEHVLADAFFAVMTGKVAQVTVVRKKDADGNEYACTEVEPQAVSADRLTPREYNAIASPTEAFCPQPNAEDDQALCNGEPK